MILEQPAPLERTIARIAFVSFVVEVGGSLVRHEIRSLREAGRAHITFVRSEWPDIRRGGGKPKIIQIFYFTTK